MNGTQVALGNPVTFGTSLNTLGTYSFTYVLANPYSGALVSSTCTATVTVVATPITGICNNTITNQTYYTGNAQLSNTGNLCTIGDLTNLTQTSTGRTWSCAGANGGSTQNSCQLAISYCGDGVIGTGNGYNNQEQHDDGNTIDGDGVSSTCQLESPSCV
jgi:cysteine-rich repeat protein